MKFSGVALCLAVLLILCSPLENMKNPPANEPVLPESSVDNKADEIRSFLNKTVAEITAETNAPVSKDGTLKVFDLNVFFPCIYPDNLPFYFVCKSYDETLTPLYVSPYADSLNDFLLPLKLSSDMTFANITGVLGNAGITVAKPSADEETDTRRMYKIEYTIDDLQYAFISEQEDGLYFDLFISAGLVDGA
jgi:hypothetical protein